MPHVQLTDRLGTDPCARAAYIERLAAKLPPIAPDVAARYVGPLLNVAAGLLAARKRDALLAALEADWRGEVEETVEVAAVRE